jgi:hypothetical protein
MRIRNDLRAIASHRSELTLFAVASFGLWLFWSQYTNLRLLSWWYDTQARGVTLSNPTYDLSTLPWQSVRPQQFTFQAGQLILTTGIEPYAYQAYAMIGTRGANAADIQFEAEIEAGGVTIGLLQSGDWIAKISSTKTGAFAGSTSAILGYSRSITVIVANLNPAGESRLTIKSLRLYLRK